MGASLEAAASNLITGSPPAHEHVDHPQQHEEQKDRENDETVASDALLLAKRTQPLNAARREVADQFRIRGGRAAKRIADAVEECREIVFPNTQVIVMIGRRTI